jgi:predicted RND superfamily exporter protein
VKYSWLNVSVARPKTVISIAFILIFAMALGGKNLYFRGDYKVFFEPENPQRLAFEQMQDTFSKNENASIIIAPRSGNVFTAETLAMIKDMSDEAWQTPLSTRVDSISNFQYTWAEEDDMIVEDLLMDTRQLDDKAISRIRKIALSEPNLVGRMVSPQGHVAIVNITVNLSDGDQTAEVSEITTAVKALSDKYQALYPEHDFYHTGVVLMNHSFASSAKQDAQTLVPLMFLTIILIMWILLRTFIGTLSTVIVIIASIAATMGLSGWMHMFLSTATVNVPTMVMTLAVADCIHVISSMLYGMRQGKSKKEAIRYSIELNKMPVFITSITTAIGFLSLNFAAVPILADLGNLTAIGVMFACLFSLTLLPALMTLLPMKAVNKPIESTEYTERFGEWVISNHRRILPFTLLVAIIGVGFSFKNQLNDVATEYFDDTTEFRQSTHFQQENLSGMTTLGFAIYTHKESGINSPASLQLLNDFSEWLRAQPEVDHVSTITDTFKRLNKNMHGDQQEYYRLPEDQALAAQYLLLYEMSLPYGLDLNNQLDINKSATRIIATVQNLGSKEMTEIEARAKSWFATRASDSELKVASVGLMFAYIGETNMQSMLQGTVVALVLISALLVFALRSWRMGLISLIPNLLPAGIGFGIWGLYSAQINLGLSIVLSMTLGIIVDDTVHFLSKYRHARLAGKSAEEGVRFAFASVGRALWITTLVLVLGFSVLTLSPFALNADMGMLTGIIIAVALAVDFLFLPPFLMVFDKKPIHKEKIHVDKDISQSA